MNGIVKEYEFDKSLIQKIDSITDNCIRDCQNKYFHTFDHVLVYDMKLKNFAKNETVNLTISDKSRGLYELNKKSTVARQNGC